MEDQDQKTHLVDLGEFKVGISSMRGRRPRMEDEHIAQRFLGNCYLFIVLDGHGGNEVAIYSRQRLPVRLEESLTGKNLDDKDLVEHTLKQCFIEIDREIFTKFTKDKIESGTTVNCAIITQNKIIVANCGDSRCVLGSNQTTQNISKDHKPSQKSEKLRIKEAGGIVVLGRVNGDLAVRRLQD